MTHRSPTGIIGGVDHVTVEASNFLLPTGTILVLAVFGLAMTGLWLWSLVDALLISDQRWSAAGQNKVVWVLVIVLVGVLGSLLYAVIARPALSRH